MFKPPKEMKPMSEAPTSRSKWIALWYRDKFGNISPVAAHFAQDLSGEEQPPFRGWFRSCGSIGGMAEVGDDAIGWTEIEGAE